MKLADAPEELQAAHAGTIEVGNDKFHPGEAKEPQCRQAVACSENPQPEGAAQYGLAEGPDEWLVIHHEDGPASRGKEQPGCVSNHDLR